MPDTVFDPDDPRGPGTKQYWQSSISLAQVSRRLIAGRWLILAVTIIAILVGAIQLWRRGPTYIATMSLLPSESDINGNNGMSGSGPLGIIAGLSGLQGNSVPKFIQFQDAMSSTEVAEILDRKFNLLCRAFKGECDVATRQWTPRTDYRARISSVLAALQGLPDPTLRRTPTDLAGYISNSVKITTEKTNLVRLTYAHPDPKFAAEFLALVQQATSDYLKEQDRQVLGQYVTYLSKEISVTTSVEQRQALGALLLEQERRLMLSNVHAPYAAAVLSGPNVAPKSFAAVTLALHALVGIALGILLALVPLKPLLLNLRSGRWKRA